MLQQQIQQQVGISGIILGSRRIQSLPHTGGHLRRYREQMERLILAEHEDQSSSRLLHRHCDWALTNSLIQVGSPGLYSFRAMFQLSAFPLLRASHLQTPNVFLICPVDTDECGELWFWLN